MFESEYVVFFFKQKTAYEMRISDWSSDVCSSDLGWLKAQPQRVAAAVAAQRFAGKGYELAILPGDKDADDWSVVLGVANVGELSPWCLAKAAERLPEGAYRLAEGSSGAAALGWRLAQYRFEKYKKAQEAAADRKGVR